jgi:hypothetical protein
MKQIFPDQKFAAFATTNFVSANGKREAACVTIAHLITQQIHATG